ncbi:MAG: energy-coupling factor ABC transporter ATP-binding protein [Bryobacteraceae bacterium]|nr:energy-coupling factor ABC transporter ATP-binding protein [Bryobacteraceae bacterium]
MAAEPLIRVRNLRYRYEDGTLALDGLSFELYPGETVAVLGPNGSGKTTFVLHLNGLLRGEGEIIVCGLRIEKGNLEEIRRRVGLLFQDPDEQLFMPTVLEDVAFALLCRGMDPAEAERRARAALAQVGLEGAASRPPYHLSAGEKRRAALAAVLASQPEILVLDEPTTYLDPPARRELITLLGALPQAKLIVTHDADFAAAIADRAVFLHRGKIVAEGRVSELVHRYGWTPHTSGRRER